MSGPSFRRGQLARFPIFRVSITWETFTSSDRLRRGVQPETHNFDEYPTFWASAIRLSKLCRDVLSNDRFRSLVPAEHCARIRVFLITRREMLQQLQHRRAISIRCTADRCFCRALLILAKARQQQRQDTHSKTTWISLLPDARPRLRELGELSSPS